MNYYPFHVGDYRSDTSHLSLLEHGIYRQLIDWYYLDEHCIPAETQLVFRRLQARTDDEKSAVQTILDEFFRLTPEGYSHSRCDAEIAKYQSKAEVARSNGKSGGRPKKTDPVISGFPQESGSKANQEPLTKNQEPLTIDSVPSGTAAGAAELTKAELWKAGKSLLAEQGMPKAQCGSFVGKLCKDYGDAVVIDAVRATCVARPADAAEYLKAMCLHGVGKRKPAEPEWRTEQRERTQQAAPGVAAYQPADQFFLEVKATDVTPRRLG